MASHHPCLYPLASHQRTTPGSALTRCRTHRHWLQHTEPVLNKNGSEDESPDSPLRSVGRGPNSILFLLRVHGISWHGRANTVRTSTGCPALCRKCENGPGHVATGSCGSREAHAHWIQYKGMTTAAEDSLYNKYRALGLGCSVHAYCVRGHADPAAPFEPEDSALLRKLCWLYRLRAAVVL